MIINLIISYSVFLLFILLTKKIKFVIIIYSIIESIISIFINSKIVFSAFAIFTIFYIVKSILRIIFSKKIYVEKKYNHYHKMFRFFKKKKNINKKEESIG